MPYHAPRHLSKHTQHELFFDGPTGVSASPTSPTMSPSVDDMLDAAMNGSPVDAQINHDDAIRYWSSVSADNTGVLGGYPQVSRVDLQGSTQFLAKLRRKSKAFGPNSGSLPRVVDCGAGIGRVTKGFLGKVAAVVDVVEPVKQLTDVITVGEEFEELRRKNVVGEVYNVGLESWTPPKGSEYTVIWNQWCLGQLTDRQLIEYFRRIKPFVSENGWIVVKENMSTDPNGEDIFDETDSSVTRSDDKFRRIFERAGLRLIAQELQRGMPKGLYPVRTYGLVVGEEETEEEDEEAPKPVNGEIEYKMVNGRLVR